MPTYFLTSPSNSCLSRDQVAYVAQNATFKIILKMPDKITATFTEKK